MTPKATILQGDWPPPNVDWFYHDEWTAIANADCREVLPKLPKVDLVLADPPYGINESSARVASRQRKPGGASKSLANQKDYGVFNWDTEPAPDWIFGWLKEISRHQIIWGGNYFNMPPSSCWLVWDKVNGENDFADCELAWTNLPKAVRRITHLWNGMLRKDNEPRWHPTQKPLGVIAWAIQQAPDDCAVILDPFAGSCTTAVAAKQLGRRCICIERELSYCETGLKRLQQEYLPLTVPSVAPTQEGLPI